MTPPILTLVPPPAPETPAGLERATRDEMLRALSWRVSMTPPAWKQVLFLGKPQRVKLPAIPPGVVERLKGLKKEFFTPDEVGINALALAEGLQGEIPTGGAPRSMGAARALPAPRDALSGWDRKAFLAATGPAVVPMLVGGGALTPDDVDFFVATYPAEMEEQRLVMNEAAAVAAGAARRAGSTVAFPSWLDDQLLTLMDEPRDTAHFQSLYAPEPGAEGGGAPPGAGVGGGSPSKIADQFNPKPSSGSM